MKASDGAPVASGSGSGKCKTPLTLSAQPELKHAKGYTAGAANYTSVDIDLLLDAAEEVLPIRGTGWVEVEKLFNQHAKALGCPTHTLKLLELKLKQVSLSCDNSNPVKLMFLSAHKDT